MIPKARMKASMILRFLPFAQTLPQSSCLRVFARVFACDIGQLPATPDDKIRIFQFPGNPKETGAYT
jgi:hypothetical protein